MVKTKSIHILLNPASGLNAGEDGTPESVRRAFLESGLDAEIHLVNGPDLGELTREMVRNGAEIIVAGGGDGTINAVASTLAGTGVALGVLPLGTLNHFARDLKMPFALDAAAKVIAAAHTIQVDLGEVNGRRFINNVAIGLYPAYRFRRDRRERRGQPKWLAIISSVLGVFRWNPALSVRVDAEGQGLTSKTPFLMVANNLHEMEGYHLGSRARLDEGRLWVYVMHRMSRLGLLRLAFSVLLGRFSKMRDFDVFSAREVTLESRRKTIGVSLDGEVVRMRPPLHYQSLPGALRVIVPAPGVSHS